MCVCVCALTDFSYRSQHELMSKEPIYYYSAIRYAKKCMTSIGNSATEIMFLRSLKYL